MQTVKFFPGLHNKVLGFSSSITAEKVIEQTNQQRINSGLKPLVTNQKLSAAALAKAQDMLDDQYWAHVSPDGRQPWDFIKEANYTYRVAGENLARDFQEAESMMQAWMSSPTHKANVLNNKYEQIGIAVVDGKLEGFETTLVVQMFGTPQVAQVKTASKEISASNEVDENTAIDQAQKEDYKPVFAIDESVKNQEKAKPVLAGAMVPIGNLSNSPIFTPLQLIKAFFLGVIMLIVLTLVYDSFVIGNRKTMRLVGQNFAHIFLFSCVAFLLIFFKGGMIK
ncbi:MAG: CAP domain-containing protein [Patescibacteria group bacterium]|nr:CAP domain-containing protein [Patescibacteria group bacterium]